MRVCRPHDADNKSPDATVLSMRQQAVAVEFLIHNAAILFEQASLPGSFTVHLYIYMFIYTL
jgi:hypothetical protein